jgi:hypothetical protein
MFSIYENIPLYNHPPLVSLWLKLLMALIGGRTNLFPQMFRMLPILADLGSAILIWKITRLYFPAGSALARSLLATLSPILVMVSGFHGNTDPVFGFLILLAAYLLAVRRNLFASAIVLALAANIKIVPVLAFPAFFFWIAEGNDRVRFLFWFGVTASLGYAAHLYAVPAFIVRNVFLYAGIAGIWGIGRLAPPSLALIYRPLGIALFFVVLIVLAWRIGRRTDRGTRLDEIPFENGLNLFQSAALAYVSFLALTSGFGVQYLSWLASLAVFLRLPLAAAYTACASIFLFLVYTEWSGGLPWNYANSFDAAPWSGVILWMGYITWGATMALLVQNAWALAKPKSWRSTRLGG